MNKRKKLLMSGILTAVLFAAASGCGSTSQNVQGNVGMQGSAGAAGGTTDNTTTVKQDWDDGRARYEVEFTAAGMEYDYELDATDGRIISWEAESIYD